MTAYRRTAAALVLALVMLIYPPARAETPADYDMSAPECLSPGHLYAQSALLVDEATGETLFAKDAHIRMYPASTTKIMTLMLALESDIPLDETVTVPAEAADIPEGSSVIPVRPGDRLTFSDLLYGFMLTSGNDGAIAIAMLVDGSLDAFVGRMNARAAELGCEGTHYVNVHGYHDANHYTTAADLAVIAREAMRNETFRDIVAAPTRAVTLQRGDRTATAEVVNRNSLLVAGDKFYYPACTGIKTGHHNKAGWCFVGSAERDGKRVICVVLNCELEDQKWYDAARLFEYGFTRYEPVTMASLLAAAVDRLPAVEVENADPGDPEGGRLALNLEDIEGGGQAAQLVTGSAASMDAALAGAEIEWNRELAAPVEAGERFGTVALTVDGLRASAALTAARAVAARPEVTEPPSVTSAPTRTAPARDPESAAPRGLGAMPLVLVGLLAALAVACGCAALAARRARRRHRRRRRRRGSGRR